MQKNSLVLGVDLGTNGVRIAVINDEYKLVHFSSKQYIEGLHHCEDWEICCKSLIQAIPNDLKERLIACSIDGTSGTLIGCDYKGKPLGKALPYFIQCIENESEIKKSSNLANKSTPTSLGRALSLINSFGENIFLRHQADWISGWLLNDWTLGEEGNNIRLGWDLIKQAWPENFKDLSWSTALPEIISSGNLMGTISYIRSNELGLPSDLKIISGTTDSNAAVIATDASDSQGITVLGSTIVVKRFTQSPIPGEGITNHRVGGKWIAGGASNAGCAVLRNFFSDQDLVELSRQIDPESDSGLSLRPLAFKGERFPVNDPHLEPILEPRPISDSLYLHGLLEGLSRIEADGWKKLTGKNLEKPTKIITIGGGSKNPQWRRIRERMIKIPIQSCSRQPAEGVARIALNSMKKDCSEIN